MNDESGRAQAYRAVFLARSADEVARRYLDRLRGLVDEGFEVHVLAGRGTGQGLKTLAKEGIRARPIPVTHVGNPAGMIGAYFIIQAQLLELRPLLVHSFGHRVAWIGTFAARQARVPAVFSTMDYHWLEEDPIHLPLGPLALVNSGVPDSLEQLETGINAVMGTPYRRSMYSAYRWLAEQVSRYIVTTEFDFQLLQDMEVVPPKKLEIAIGGAGVDLGTFSLPEQGEPLREEARRQLGLPDHWRQVVGWVGPVTRRHGADNLIEAIIRLQRSHPSVGWLVALQGKVASGQRRRLDRLVRRGYVHLVDGESVDAKIYRAMDVLAWVGKTSTPHDPIGEAAAMAVPTVGFDTPGARSLIEPGQTGHLVFEHERLAMIATLSKVLDDPTYLSEMGWRARSRVQLKFSRRDVDGQMLRLYDRVLDAELEAQQHK